MSKTALVKCFGFVLFLIHITEIRANCGVEGCFCFDKTAFCSNPTTFPTNLPVETSTLYISDMRIANIPPEALVGLSNLIDLEIHASKIDTVSSGAFRGLTGLRYFGFYENSVGTIESHAFENLRNIDTLSMNLNVIREVQSYAFTNLRNFDKIMLNSMNITKIHRHAFYNIHNVKRFQFYMNHIWDMEARSFSDFNNIGRFELYLNRFQTLGCGNVEPMVGKAKVSFYSNTVSCSCGLSWVVGNEVLGSSLNFNWCQMKNARKRISLFDVDMGHLACTENSYNGCPAEVTTDQQTTSESSTLETVTETEHTTSDIPRNQTTYVNGYDTTTSDTELVETSNQPSYQETVGTTTEKPIETTEAAQAQTPSTETANLQQFSDTTSNVESTPQAPTQSIIFSVITAGSTLANYPAKNSDSEYGYMSDGLIPKEEVVAAESTNTEDSKSPSTIPDTTVEHKTKSPKDNPRPRSTTSPTLANGHVTVKDTPKGTVLREETMKANSNGSRKKHIHILLTLAFVLFSSTLSCAV